MFKNVYQGKRVFITGHTGFKGSWLTAWLLDMGAEVAGYSDCIPTHPSIFEVLGLQTKIKHLIGDVRDFDALKRAIDDFAPDFVFHLAAQAIVSLSYKDPAATITTNVVGTLNVLEVLRHTDRSCVAVFVTSDKCYENVEWLWGYRETDHLGGKDVYSGSKGAAEIVIHSYYKSFFAHPECKVRLATGRAGNVIGGGDWAQDRIVVDCMKSWSVGKPVEIRSPSATRPWQHVLEPISGYLTLAASLLKNRELSGESFNFGPHAEQNRTVVELISHLAEHWHSSAPKNIYRITDNIPFNEAGLLKLNCDKALYSLKWEACLEYAECVNLVGTWYHAYYKEDQDMYMLTQNHIDQYVAIAKRRELTWTKS